SGPVVPGSVTLAADQDAVTPQQLNADYKANAVGADLRYKDRRLVVTGVVKSISDSFGSMAVWLKDEDFFGGTCCHFTDEHRLQVAALRPGDTVRIRGVCTGKTLGSIHFHECEFVLDRATQDRIDREKEEQERQRREQEKAEQERAAREARRQRRQEQEAQEKARQEEAARERVAREEREAREKQAEQERIRQAKATRMKEKAAALLAYARKLIA